MAVKNLWGDMGDLASIQTPHELLLEQKTFLKEMTNGLLDVEIEQRQKSTLFSYEFFIVVPKMKFRQCVLRLTHDIKLYPVIMQDESTGKEYNCKSQQDFEEGLGEILSSEETRTTVAGLLAQTRLGGEIMV